MSYVKSYLIGIFLFLLAFSVSAKQYYFRNINSNQDLSSNSVYTIYRDSRGFLWIGTDLGVNCYDGYQIKTYKENSLDKNSIANNYIYSITEDASGLLWILTRAGYSVFDLRKECFYNDYAFILKERNVTQGNWIRAIIQKKNLDAYILDDYSVSIYDHEKMQTLKVKDSDKKGFITGCIDSKRYLWLLDKDFALLKVNMDTGDIVDRSSYLSGKGLSRIRLFMDDRNNVWAICDERFLVQYNPAINQWREFSDVLFDSYLLRCITQNENNIYIGTDHGGLYVIDMNTFSIKNIKKTNELYSLSDNTVSSLYSDADGILWIGTYKYGLDCYHPLFNSFHSYKINESKWLNDINCFAEDSEDRLWIGTNDDGLYVRAKDESSYKKISYNPKGDGKGTIVSLFQDSKQRLWIGTFMDGLYCYADNKFVHFDEKDGIDSSVWCIGEDNSGNVWIGSLNKGIFRYVDSEKRFVASRYNAEKTATTIECIFRKEADNELCFGTSVGIQVISASDELVKFFRFNKPEDTTTEKNYINRIVQDLHGYYWVCTQGGLAVVDANMKNYHFFTEKEGIEQNTVYMAIVDKNNDIWVSTPKGLFCIQVISYGNLTDMEVRISKYGKEDGLQDNIFNAKSGLLTKDNKVIFGGVNGYNVFDPSEIVHKEQGERLSFTNLYINNRLVKIGEELNGRVLLEQALTNCKKVVLKYDENNMRIEFSALDLLYPQKYKYEYKLEGKDKDWQNVQGVLPAASYSDLDYGKYQLRVRAVDQSGAGYVQEKMIGIEVLPPFWLSWPAFLIYFIVAVLAVYYIVRNIMLRTALKYKIMQQQLEKAHMEEMNNMKINFFTNLSHELRTPVSLIILPIENLLVQEKNWAIKNKLNMVLRNAKRLLFIVNQLLDFRKLEAGEISYNPMVGDLVSFVKNAAAAFADMAQSKNVKLSFTGNVEELYTQFDPTKMERIIFNLLSNAFKFTPHGGEVAVSVEYDEGASLPIKISVSDTGIGIEEKELRNIFKPFYQVESNGRTINIGTGIGLSIIHDFVHLHQGEIDVKSEIGKGTTFIIELPLVKGDESLIEQESAETSIQTDVAKPVQSLGFSPKEHTVLVIDDNDDFRYYLVENLRHEYNVLEAEDGEAGFEKACKHIPDLIISDVMMPKKDGLQLCEMLKAQDKTASIPVVLLTASVSEQDKIKGLELGIDVFLTKPFNLEVLKAQIANLLKKQEVKKETEKREEPIVAKVEHSSQDEKLLNKVITIMDQHLSESTFGVEQLSKEIGISTVYLNKKISAMTGKTTSEYVRSLRIKKGAALLSKTQMSIAEIAYEVGYTEPKYFSKYFKEEYGMLPSEYRKNYK